MRQKADTERGHVGRVQPYESGPLLPFPRLAIAPAQLHQTGHSSIAQHFRKMKVGSADQSAIDL